MKLRTRKHPRKIRKEIERENEAKRVADTEECTEGMFARERAIF
jgi:hypothetical protein